MASVSDAFVSMTPEETTALSALTAKGWSPNAAKAMVATLAGESGPHLNTGVYQGEGGYGPKGTSWDRLGSAQSAAETAAGIANWNGSRAINAANYATAQGQDPNALNTQLGFLDREARSRGLPVTSGADPAALTTQFTGQFEQPAVNNGPQRWASFQAGAPATPGTAAMGTTNSPLPMSMPASLAPIPPDDLPPAGGNAGTANAFPSVLGGILSNMATALSRPRVPVQAPQPVQPQAPMLAQLLAGTHPGMAYS